MEKLDSGSNLKRAWTSLLAGLLALQATDAHAWSEFDLSKTAEGSQWLQTRSAFHFSRPQFLSQWFSADGESDATNGSSNDESSTDGQLPLLFESLNSNQKDSSLSSSILASNDWTFSAGSERSGHGIQSLRLKATYKGVPVIGGRVSLVHSKRSRGMGSLLLQEAIEPFDLSVSPSIPEAEAFERASNYEEGFAVVSAPRLRVVVNPAPEPARLIWLTTLRNDSTGTTWVTWLDAHRGEWIAAMPVRLSLAPIHVYQADPTCQEIDNESGAPTSLDLGKCPAVIMNGKPMLRADTGRPPVSADESSLRAAQNSRRVLQYFLDQHSRDSYDGKSGEVVSVVHIGRNFDNAFWDSEAKMMAYGDGDGETTGDFTLGLDVAGHEMTHGVISATADLIYAGESGALNEAYADFFGKMIENENDWTIGKKLFLDPANAEGFRDLKEPGRIQYTIRNDAGRTISRPYPATVTEKATTRKPCDDARNDNCYVHINATIPGHAFFQLHTRLGKRTTERILYSTLTHFLSETSNFNENAKGMRSACRELYPSGENCSRLDEVLNLIGFTY